MSVQSLPSAVYRQDPRTGVSYSACLLAYLYLSRFGPDALLVAAVLGFAAFGRIRLNMLGLSVAVGITLLIALQVFIVGGRLEHPAQPFHLIYLLLLMLAIDDLDFRPQLVVQFCKFTTLLNLALLGAAFVPSLTDILVWGAGSGGGIVGRYQSVLPEPSFLALYSVLNFYVLLLAGSRRWAFANLVPLAATFSFSGVLAFAFLGLVFVRTSWRPVMAAGVTLLAILVATYVAVPDTFTALIVSRAEDILAGGGEESLTLRLFAPIDLARSVLTGPHSLLGLGIGNVEYYIYYNQAELPNHWRADGIRSSEPDSVIAFVIAAFGILGSLVAAFGAWLLLSGRPKRREFSVLRWYLVAMAVFSGLFISVHFLVWIYLLRQEQLYREDSPTGAATAIPA